MKQLTIITMTLCLLTIIISPSFAGEQSWNFESGSADDWSVANGDWNVTDGVYELALGAQAEHSLVGDVAWTDYTVETKVRLDEGNWAGIAYRAKSEMEYYVYYMNVPDNKTELWRHKTGGWTARDKIGELQGTNVTIENGKWYDMKVDVEGDTMALTINGEMQGELTDGTAAKISAGQAGVWGWQTGASFDDFKVYGDDIESPVTPVKPLHKLTTIWGSIKNHH